jgi:hypothetical protein
MLFIPTENEQIPDDFRDWTEARTFEIGAQIALPPRLPLDYLKRAIIRQPAEGLPIGEIHPQSPYFRLSGMSR